LDEEKTYNKWLISESIYIKKQKKVKFIRGLYWNIGLQGVPSVLANRFCVDRAD